MEKYEYEENKEEQDIPTEQVAKQIEKLNLVDEIQIIKYPIAVTEYSKREGLNSFHEYKIIGRDYYSNEINVFRRFSEFYALRSRLLERWPGIFIPNIPPKKTIGNKDMKIVEYRKIQLNRFLEKISNFEYLFSSEEMEIFLNKSEVEKKLNNLPNEKYDSLRGKYERTFQTKNEVAIDINEEYSIISTFFGFCQKSLHSITNFSEIVEKTMESKSEEILSYLNLLNVFTDYEKYSLSEFLNNEEYNLIFYNSANSNLCIKMLELKKEILNPYSKICSWLFEQELDLRAVIDSINSWYKLLESKEKLFNKINSFQKKIDELNSGKKNFSTFFGIKSKDKEVGDIQQNKSALEFEVADLEVINKIVASQIIQQIKPFKQTFVKNYYDSLKYCAEVQKSNVNNIHDLWSLVEKTKELKVDKEK